LIVNEEMVRREVIDNGSKSIPQSIFRNSTFQNIQFQLRSKTKSIDLKRFHERWIIAWLI